MGVIMGANIGTTITGWIVSMGEWASFLKSSILGVLSWAPVISFKVAPLCK